MRVSKHVKKKGTKERSSFHKTAELWDMLQTTLSLLKVAEWLESLTSNYMVTAVSVLVQCQLSTTCEKAKFCLQMAQAFPYQNVGYCSIYLARLEMSGSWRAIKSNFKNLHKEYSYLHYSLLSSDLQTIWATTRQNQQSDCVPREDSDQPGYLPSLIRVFIVRMKKAWVLSYPLSAQRRLWSDCVDAQADLSLPWVHTYFVGFVMSRLICQFIAFEEQCEGSKPFFLI